MLFDVLQNYMDAVNGATRLTQRSATAMARTILIQAGMQPAADMVHRLSEQLIAAQDAQYAMIRQMIQSEVVMTMERMGLASQVMGSSQARGSKSAERTPAEAPSAPAAPALEINERTADTGVLAPVPDQASPGEETRPDEPPREDRGRQEAGQDPVAEPAPTPETIVEPPLRKAPVKSAQARKAPAKKTPARKAPARKTAARTAPASQVAPATKAAPAATKSPAKKSPAKKTATRSTATRSTATRATASRTAAKRSAPGGTTDDNASS